jgi:hypothetical protein
MSPHLDLYEAACLDVCLGLCQAQSQSLGLHQAWSLDLCQARDLDLHQAQS